MTSISQDNLPCHGIPYLHSAVAATGGDKFAIRRPGYCTGIALEGRDRLPCGGIPYLYSAIKAGGGNILAIGRPGHLSYIVAMFTIGRDDLAGRGIPYIHNIAIAAI